MKRLARSPLALLAAIVFLRSAGFAFGVLNIDESDYVLYGTGIFRGLLPYRDLVEIKPPLGYLTYWPSGLFGGLKIWPMQLVAVLWVFASAMLVRAAVKRWLRSRELDAGESAGWAAAWLYLLSLLCELPMFGGEVMLDLPAAAALYCLARAENDRAESGPARSTLWIFLSGLCASLASLYKHQGAILLVAFGLAYTVLALLPAPPNPERKTERPIRRGLAAIALLTLGFAIPWLACIALYASLHQLPNFFDWVFTRNLLYAGKGVAGSALARGVQSTLLCCGGTIVPWVLAVRASWHCLRSLVDRIQRSDKPRDHPPDGFFLAATLLLWLTWLAVATGGRFYEHYYLQFAPALAVLGAREAGQLARGFANLSRIRKWMLTLGCAVPVLALTAFSWARGMEKTYPEQNEKVRIVSAFIRDNSRAGETLFIWGHFSPIYLLAERMPGTRYLNTTPQMGNFDPSHLPDDFDASKFRSERDVAAALDDLAHRKPDLVVDTAPADIHDWHRVPLRDFPSLSNFIETHYRKIGTPAGAVVYRRIDGAE